MKTWEDLDIEKVEVFRCGCLFDFSDGRAVRIYLCMVHAKETYSRISHHNSHFNEESLYMDDDGKVWDMRGNPVK
jgi:hypothetical protein